MDEYFKWQDQVEIFAASGKTSSTTRTTISARAEIFLEFAALMQSICCCLFKLPTTEAQGDTSVRPPVTSSKSKIKVDTNRVEAT